MSDQLFAIAMEIAKHIPAAIAFVWAVRKLEPRTKKNELRIAAHEHALPILRAAPDMEPVKVRR